MAPDVEQAQVVNHYTGHEMREIRLENRHVLAESARIVRGKISSINEISAHDLDALIIPGGYGVVQNLCNYATAGANATVHPDVARLIVDMNGLGKPIGALCIAPVTVALALQGRENAIAPVVTVGNDASIALNLEKFGARHMEAAVSEICIDSHNKIVSTPAFMLAGGPAEAEEGITKLVNQVLAMAREIQPGYRGDGATSSSVAPA